VGQTSRSKTLVPIEKSCHKEHTYEIPITYHSKDMANVKSFLRTDRQTGQKLYAPDLSIRGHKNCQLLDVDRGYKWNIAGTITLGRDCGMSCTNRSGGVTALCFLSATVFSANGSCRVRQMKNDVILNDIDSANSIFRKETEGLRLTN
jgi:hypothetical protein